MNGMSKSALKVDWATHDAVKHACARWHYSKSVPVPPLVKIGVWEFDKFIGVVVFSRGASSNLMKPYGLKQTQGCELTRVALTKHTNTVSRILAIAVKFLKKQCPDLQLIVSFADPHYGHHGGIYQACGWLYAGDTAKGREYIYNGKRLHSRQVSEKGWNIQQGQRRKTIKPSQCTIIETPGKHRYLLPLSKQMRKRVQHLALPYPKRVGSADSGTSDNQSERGGAIPTPTLSLQEV